MPTSAKYRTAPDQGANRGAPPLPPDLQAALVAQIPAMRRYARALSKNPHEADDLVQESLARALERVRCWRSIRNLRTYLFSILHNLHVDGAARRQRAGIPVPLESVLNRLACRPAQLARLEAADLGRALERLPAAQRRVLLQVGVDGASYREAAALLRLPIGTVMSRLARGRTALRRFMQED